MSDEIKITPIKMVIDRSEFTDGDTVKKVRGKITNLYEIRKGGDGNDTYEYQNGEFVGEDGGKTRICFSKCSQTNSIKNKTITITAHKGKDGWTGMKVIDKTFTKDGKEEVRRELRISPTANIEIEGGGQTSDGGGSSSQQKPTGGGGQSQPKFDGHPRPFLEDMVALHYDINTLVNEKYGEKAKQEFIATIFIEAGKNGLAFNYRDRASKPIPVKYPPAPKDPNDWKECVMPWGKEGVIGKKLSELDPETLKTIHNYFDEKKINTDLANCVYQAAIDLNLFPKTEEEKKQESDDRALDPAPDDIPF